MLNSKSIISLNVDRQTSKLNQLLQLARSYDPIAILIQDLPSICHTEIESICNYKDAMEPNMIFYDAYTQNLNDSTNNVDLYTRAKRDNIILLDKRIKGTIIKLSENLSELASTLGLQIELTDGRKYQLYSIYIRPKAQYYDVKIILDTIRLTAKELGNSRTIILGDINAEAAEWAPDHNLFLNSHYNQTSDKHYHQIRINRGKQISNALKDMKLTLLNNINEGPTYTGNLTLNDNQPQVAYIDIAAAGEKAHRVWRRFELKNVDNSSRGHKAIIITSNDRQTSGRTSQVAPLPHDNTEYKYPLHKITSELFTELKMRLDKTCVQWEHLPRKQIMERMNLIADTTYERILQVQNHIKIAKRSRKSNSDNYGYHRKLLKQIKKLKRSKKIAKQLRLTSRINRNRNTLNKNKLSKKLQTRKKALKMMRRMKARITHTLKRQIENQNRNIPNGPRQIWRAIEQCNQIISDYNQLDRTEITLPKEKSEDVDKIAGTKFPFIKRNAKDTTDTNSSDELEIVTPILITDTEITEALKSLRNKRYTGVEGVKFAVFNRVCNYIPRIVHTLCKMSFYTTSTPECCHTTIGTLIPKKESNKYRIVHISTPLASLLEQIALHRLEYRLEANGLHNPYQFGFRALRGRHDLITRIIELTIKHRREELLLSSYKTHRTTIISLDIEGAFDNVNQDKLISKLMTDLDTDNLKHWLTFFILNRSIILKHNNHRSKKVTICRGVPQGSSLGPVLWNYTINKIDHNITIPGRLELLAYADDLYLIYNGPEQKLIQQKLDLLTQQLNDIDLKINPTKCSTMCIYDGIRGQHRHDYKIYGQNISEVKHMKILGVTVNHLLKLKTQSQDDAIKRNVELLQKLNHYGVIKEPKQWQMIIDSYLRSTIIINNAPILAIDPKAREWADNTMIKCIKTIFKWPRNVSNKLTCLITNSMSAELTIENYINKKLQTEHQHGYQLLLKIMKYSTYEEYSGIKHILDNNFSHKRKQPNPTLFLDNPSEIDIRTIMGPLWYIIERDEGSITIELLGNLVLQVTGALNTSYPIKYFNSLTALWRLTERVGISNRNLALHSDSTLLRALTNNSSHDWRTITLRERLIINGWNIYTMNDKNKNWIRYIAKNIQSANIEITRTPDLTDYKENNLKRRETNTKMETEMTLNQTNFMKTLRARTLIWTQMSPSEVSSLTMLTLSGLYINERNNLTKSGSEVCQFEGCDRRDEENIIAHRMWECRGFHRARMDIMGLGRKPDDLRSMMDDRLHCNKILKLATRCAMER